MLGYAFQFRYSCDDRWLEFTSTWQSWRKACKSVRHNCSSIKLEECSQLVLMGKLVSKSGLQRRAVRQEDSLICVVTCKKLGLEFPLYSYICLNKDSTCCISSLFHLLFLPPFLYNSICNTLLISVSGLSILRAFVHGGNQSTGAEANLGSQLSNYENMQNKKLIP